MHQAAVLHLVRRGLHLEPRGGLVLRREGAALGLPLRRGRRTTALLEEPRGRPRVELPLTLHALRQVLKERGARPPKRGQLLLVLARGGGALLLGAALSAEAAGTPCAEPLRACDGIDVLERPPRGPPWWEALDCTTSQMERACLALVALLNHSR